MEKAIENFISILEKMREVVIKENSNRVEIFIGKIIPYTQYMSCKHYEKGMIGKTEERLIEYIDAFISILRDEEVDYNFSLCSFWALSQFLEKVPLKIQDILSILTYFIDYNNKYGLLADEAIFLDTYKVKNVQLITLTTEELIELINTGVLYPLLHCDKRELSTLQLAQRCEINAYLDQMKVDVSKEQKNVRAIYEHLIDHQDPFTEEDMNIVVNSFKALDISESVLEKVAILLQKRVDKGSKVTTSISLEKKSIPKKSTYIMDNKTYKEHINHIKGVYNLYTGQLVKKKFPYEEMREYLKELYLLGEDDSQLMRFLQRYQEKNKIEKDASKEYCFIRDELIHTLGIGMVHDADEYLEMMEVDPDSRAFWENALREELQELLKCYPKPFVYEIELMKREVKESKEKEELILR